ncbi:MAG TPA: hypothetical protein VLI67_10645 [Vicinamibacteria bacterium]|nr:hypothetical protein [Vicinamibacteria bacterium]
MNEAPSRPTSRAARRTQTALLVLLAGVAGGCLVEVDEVADPAPAFAQARREAARYQGRPGPAHRVNVLVYEHEEGQLVRVSVPMWLARKIARDRDGFELDLGEDARAGERLRRHVRFRDVEKAGLGVLLEVEEEGGDLVLVWLK